MLSTITVLALAVAAQAAPTAPTAPRSVTVTGDGFHTLPVLRNPNYTRNATAALLKAYRKYNIKPTKPMPAEFTRALQKRQDGSVEADPGNQNSEYSIPVDIGGQTLQLDLDTGSSDLWVFSTELPSNEQSGHTIYNSGDSSTFQTVSGCTWQISYGDGSGASGDCGTDTVTVGSTVVQGQVVELASQVSSQFVQDTANDGLIGMAFSSINTAQPQAQTFFDNAGPSLQSDLFAAYLPNAANGAYDFGYTDSSKYSGDIQYTSVDSSQGFWQYSSPNYAINGQQASQQNTEGISDTGTTLILMGDDVVDAYYAQVSGASQSSGQYNFPCDAQLPTLGFSIGDNFATIPSNLLNFAANGDGTCAGALQSVGSQNMNIYGDTFFQAYYSVFDASGPQFGFAQIA